VAYACGVLTLAQMYAVAFGTSTLSVLFTVSDPAVFVALVPPSRYVEGNSLVYGSRAMSFVAGPSAGGLLVQALTAPAAVLADALSFLGSAFFLSRIRPVEPPPEAARRGALTAGARFIRHSAIARSSLTAGAVINFFNFAFFALFVLYATRTLQVRPRQDSRARRARRVSRARCQDSRAGRAYGRASSHRRRSTVRASGAT
jgi:hypothetical protein